MTKRNGRQKQETRTRTGGITEHERLEQALQESEALNRALLDAVPDLMIRINADGTILDFKPAKWVDTPAPPAEVIGKNTYDLLPQEGAEKAMQHVRRTLLTGEVQRYEYQLPVGGETHDREVRVVVTGEEEVVLIVRDITERRQAEEALRESEVVLRATLEATADGILVVDNNSQVLHANARFAKMWHVPKKLLEVGDAEKLRRAVADQLEDPEAFLSGLRELYETPQETLDALSFRDGRVFERLSRPLMREGKVAGRVWSFRDVTERKRAEEALMARAHQQVAVAELGHRALTGLDLSALLDETVVLLAQVLKVEYCKVLQLLPDGSAFLLQSGEGWKEGYVGHATVGAEAQSQAGYTLLYDEPVVVEDLSKETRFSAPPLLAEHGVVSGMSVIIQGPDRPYGVLGAHTTRRRTFSEDDIHFLQAVANVLGEAIERKRAEEALRESEAKFRTLAETMPALVFIIQGSTLLYVNSAVEAATGYTRGELVTMNVLDLVHPDHRELVSAGAGALRPDERDLLRNELKLLTKDGEERWFDISGSVMEFEGRPALLGTAFDITERKRLGEELQRAKEMLEGKVEQEMLQDNPYRLTFREFTVLHLVAAGRADKEIASELVISPLTAHKHVANILGKMNAASRTEAGVRALREGWLD